MAAYGAVASLLKTLDAAVSLPVHLRPQIESLRDKVSFLQHSLENYSEKICNKEIYEESLEAKIRDVGFKAEDLIASKMAKHSVVHKTYADRVFLSRSMFSVTISEIKSISTRVWRKIKQSCVTIVKLGEVLDVQHKSLSEDEELREIIQEMGCIVDEVKKIEDDHEVDRQSQLARNVQLRSVESSSSGGNFSIGSGKKVVSRFEKDVEEMRTRLYNNLLKLVTVPIVGMGGIGKTTLARRLYDDAYFDDHFDIRAWATVSQEYSPRKVFVNLLDSGKMLTVEDMNGMEEEDLALYMYQNLKHRRYLIVMDDVWDDDIWDVVQKYLPDDNNGSRVLLTTRLSKVALYVNPHSPFHRMDLLNRNDSWNLLCNVVFGKNNCPMELESIGKEIAGNCKGLPLVLGVTGGFLSKVSRTNEAWTCIADNLNSIVIQDDEQCMEILSLSYKHLPHHLRPCFLYMAMFPQDHVIRMDELSCLWAAEGFLQPGKSESVEALAEKWLEDLVERNLILLHRWADDNFIETCSIHDMLWNFCMQRAKKESFLHVVKGPRAAIRKSFLHLRYHSNQPRIQLDILTRNSDAHSLICSGAQTVPLSQICLGHHTLLKVLDLFIVHLLDFPDIITRFVNLRYLAITYNGALPPTICRLQNLETLIHGHLKSYQQCHFLPIEIWLMPKLRNIWILGSCVIDPLGMQAHIEECSLLQNLETLYTVTNLHCEFILGRMPNLRRLWISYDGDPCTVWSNYQLEALANLHQLKILFLRMNSERRSSAGLQLPSNFAFPPMLNRLTLFGCQIPWESMTIVGSLPHLEVLILDKNACQGAEWEPNDNEFLQLKYLLLREIENLVQWNADETHFPRLQHLIISSCHSLEEIPSGIGDIPTLERIELMNCPRAMASAAQILEDQKELGNEHLKVVVKNYKRRKSGEIYNRTRLAEALFNYSFLPRELCELAELTGLNIYSPPRVTLPKVRGDPDLVVAQRRGLRTK